MYTIPSHGMNAEQLHHNFPMDMCVVCVLCRVFRVCLPAVTEAPGLC